MKIKILTFVLSLFFFTLNLISQNSTFEYLLSTPMDEKFKEIVETADGSIYFSGWLSTIEQPYYKTALIAKLDNNGVLIDSNILTFPEKSLYISHIFHSGNVIIYQPQNYTKNSRFASKNIVINNLSVHF